MKSFRTWILVLVAILLPIRGAVAAAMVCPDGVQTDGAVVAVGHDHHDADPGQHGDRHDTATPEHHHGQASDDDSSDPHAGACQFCAGGCCVTPLAFAPPSLQSLETTRSASFPALAARLTDFDPDAQERPPRTR